MAKTVNVVKGSVDEKILKAQYGDAVNFNYTNQNQFAGPTRTETNKLYQGLLGKPTNDAGNFNNYTGTKILEGGYSSQPTQSSQPDPLKSMQDALAAQNKAQANLYNQQAAEQAAKIRQAIQSQTQQGNATKADYTNQMNTAIGTMDTEKAKIPGQVTKLNNSASSTGMMNAQKIRNSLAQMGLLQSGESASQQLLNDTMVSNNVNANNLQGQEIGTEYESKIASAQTDLASKTKQINDAIALAQSQGDENALYALKDAQAKIANAGAQSAVDYNNFAYTAGRDAVNDRMTQQQMEARAIQQALDNTYRQSQAEMGKSQWEREFALRQAKLGSGGSGGGGYGYNEGTNNTYGNVTDANASTRTMVSQIINALQSGATIQEVMADIDQMERDGTAAAKKYDTQLLRNLANSIPVDNWQYQSR